MTKYFDIVCHCCSSKMMNCEPFSAPNRRMAAKNKNLSISLHVECKDVVNTQQCQSRCHDIPPCASAI